MNQLLAKIKNKTKTYAKSFKKLTTEENCFVIPENISSIEYNPDTLLEDGQWYFINNFSEQDYCLDLFKCETFNSVDFESITKDEFTAIDYLCFYQNDIYFIQKVRPAQLVIKKRIVFGDSCTIYNNSKSIVINKYPDAIYIKEEDKLYFQKLETITSVFKGIDILFKEATEEETNEFLNFNFISLKNDLSLNSITKNTRKKIKQAITILNNLTDEDKGKMIKYTKKYSGLLYSKNKFILQSEDDVNKLINGINERYYETEISKEKRVANSIQKIE
jgi:hypothetical protein